jgi:hypothetical protein
MATRHKLGRWSHSFDPMLTLNEQLGHVTRQQSITLASPLPLGATSRV